MLFCNNIHITETKTDKSLNILQTSYDILYQVPVLTVDSFLLDEECEGFAGHAYGST